MRVLLVGNGGREAALAWRIARSPSLGSLTVTAPNPGWPEPARVVPCADLQAIVSLAVAERSDLVVVGPEAPLAAGLADALIERGILVFGPTRAAARLESSKAFAKEVMRAAGVPTAPAWVVDCADPAQVAAARDRCARGRVVIKADGLAAGKGVFVCPSADEAARALQALRAGKLGAASDRLVLEDLLEGPEVSVFGLSDGARVVPLLSAQDHKRLADGDRGPNTGGMGAYAPCPLVDEATAERIVDTVHRPVIAEMARRGTPFRGVLYAGLMMTEHGPRVLEFNVRFGDPECQALMCLWADDVLLWLHAAAAGALPEGRRPAVAPGAACCVVLAAAGYPDEPVRGVVMREAQPIDGVVVFHAGSQREPDGTLRTTGGRVLGVTGVGLDLADARARAYAGVAAWRFPGAQVRSDIGGRA